MADGQGAWIMQGMDWDNPRRIKSYRELISLVNETGFLPLFKNEIEGFSAEEHVSPLYWWTGDQEQDPWVWRELIAGAGEVAYGKFFGRKAGFISMEWFPVFVNFRRDGYDFDARWDDELIGIRHKGIMDCFENSSNSRIAEYTGLQLKQLAGFGKGGHKNFDGIMTDLQMQTYLVIREFRRKRNKKGQEYGMPVCVYCRPEDLWGYEVVTGSYREEPLRSKEKIYGRLKELYPDVDGKAADRLLMKQL